MSNPKPTDLLLDEAYTTLEDLDLNCFFYLCPNGLDTKVYKLVKRTSAVHSSNEYRIVYEDIDKGKRYSSLWRGNKTVRRAYTARQAVSEGKVKMIRDYLDTIKHHPHQFRKGVAVEYLKDYLNRVNTVQNGLPKGPITIIKEGKGKTNMSTNKLNSVVSMAQAQRNMFVVALAQFEEGGKEYHFKLPSTLSQVVKAGDYVVAENRNGSWNKAVVKVTEVKTHGDLPYDAHEGPWAWIISKVGVNAFETMKEGELNAIKTLKAQAARKNIIDDLDVTILDVLSAVDNS